MTTNHKTTTLLVAIAATLLAAGTVAALGSNHFALAWHKEYKKSYGEDNEYGKDKQRDGDQYLNCIVIGGSDGSKSDSGMKQADPVQSDKSGGGISDNSCNNYDGSSNPETVWNGGGTTRSGSSDTADSADIGNW
jgi:hypothetical protein